MSHSDSDDFVSPVKKKVRLDNVDDKCTINYDRRNYDKCINYDRRNEASNPKQCDICNKIFQRPNHVLRHKKAVHLVNVCPIPKEPGKYKCSSCEKTFTTARSRWRHTQNVHKNKCLDTAIKSSQPIAPEKNEINKFKSIKPKNICSDTRDASDMSTNKDDNPANMKECKNEMHACNICNKIFRLRSHLLRHNRSMHMSSEKKTFNCLLCDKSYSLLKNCERHEKYVHSYIRKLKFSCGYCECACKSRKELVCHLDELCMQNVLKSSEKMNLPIKSTDKYGCRVCKKQFSFLSSCRKHEIFFHAYNLKKSFVCALCKCAFKSRNVILEHVAENHEEYSKPEEKITLKSLTEFNKWKTEIEKENFTSYILTGKSYESRTKIVKMYSCHRSGHFKSAGKRIRYRKLSKTNKIGSFCPAYIRAEICKTSDQVSIKYCPTHLGHDFKVKYLRLSKQEKEQIAGELHSGVPPSFILNKISETASPTKRLAATTSQDIRNISKCYGINMNVVRSEDDVTSVDCWVKEMQSGNHNPILLYKLPGDINSELPDMEEDDFVLGFMNLAQEEILKIYGKDVILIDSTHGTNKYNIQLTTLVIKDDNWEGFPVAFLWSNRQHKNVFRYFFQSIRERVGDIKTNAFMSDDYVAFYNAWYSVFSKPNFYVLCDWHVKRSWKKNLTSGATQIKNKDKLQDTLDMLYEMINEVDINTFEKLYKRLQTKLLTDPETFFFGCYFIAEYGNRTKQWAACYRVGSRINTNMTVERWHKDLKYNSDLKGKCGGRLDKAIHSLMKSLRLKLSNRLSSLQRGKLTKKLVLIRKTHKMAESIKEEIAIYEQADKLSYIVTSASHEGETYKVRILDLPEDHKCNLKCETCNVCIHKMTCECPNASIKFNMCKHIHVVCMKKYNFADCENTGLNICEPVCDIEESLMPSRIPQIELEPEYVTKEKEAIANSKLCSNPYNKLKEAAISAVMGLVTEIETFQNEEQYKELIKCVSVAKHKCRALNSLKTLPPVSTTTSSLKKIEPQRRFPSKKKKTKKEPLRPNYNSKDTIQRILTSNPETYAVAKEAVLVDHNYDIQES